MQMNEVDEVLARFDKEGLPSEDLDKLIAMYREHRGRVLSGAKVKKGETQTFTLASIGLSAEKPKSTFKRRI